MLSSILLPDSISDVKFFYESYTKLLVHCLDQKSDNAELSESLSQILIKILQNPLKSTSDKLFNLIFTSRSLTNQENMNNSKMVINSLNNFLKASSNDAALLKNLKIQINFVFQKMQEAFRQSGYGVNELTENMIILNNFIFARDGSNDRNEICQVIADYLVNTTKNNTPLGSGQPGVNRSRMVTMALMKANYKSKNFVEEILIKSPLVQLENMKVLMPTRRRLPGQRLSDSEQMEEQNEIQTNLAEELLMTHGFFTTAQDQRNREGSTNLIRTYQQVFLNSLFDFLATLITKKSSRESMVIWISKLIEYFQVTSKSGVHSPFLNYCTVSDAIFWNLSIILVKMSLPFCKNGMISKINDFYYYGEMFDDKKESERLKIFSTSFESDSSTRRVETGDMGDEDDEEPKAYKTVLDAQLMSLQPVNFITQCFNLTHRCLALCLTGLFNKYDQAARYVHRLDYTTAMKQILCINMHLFSIEATLYEETLTSSMIIFCKHSLNYFSSKPIHERPPLPNIYIENVVSYLQGVKKREPNFLELQDEITVNQSTSHSLPGANFQKMHIPKVAQIFLSNL